LLSPTLSKGIGNIFFGSVPGIYSVKAAQVFFVNAAYPIFNTNSPEFAHYQLSRTYFITGDLSNALTEIQKEIELYPEQIRSYYILGLTLGYLGRERDAIDAFSTFIEAYPESWAGRNDKAWLQFRIGDIDGALKTIEPVTEGYKANIWVQNTHCVLLINKKDYMQAREACNNAKIAVDTMTEEDWGGAYPGNDPRIYTAGLEATKKAIEENLKLIENTKTSDN